MTPHLSSEELTSALDGTLEPTRRLHLETCAACRSSLDELEEMAGLVRADADVAEPSPMYLDQLSRRIREATEGEATGGSTGLWRPLLAFGAIAAMVALVVTMRLSRGPADASVPTDVLPNVAMGGDPAAGDEAQWRRMAELASTLTSDEVQQVVASTPETPGAVGDLTPTEREAFVALVKVELGDVQ